MRTPIACWNILCGAAGDARTLRLVDAHRFIDRRSDEPLIIPPDNDGDRGAYFGIFGPMKRPAAELSPAYSYRPERYDEFPDIAPRPSLMRPVFGERYAIEIWIEKSTANDILAPLARRLGVSLVTGEGEMSQNRCTELVERIKQHRRRTRILYISDFDPGGDNMPVSVARKIEFLLRRDQLDLDVRVIPIALTAEQVSRFRLPRIPIKESDVSKRHFEERYGEGATELDALEALHPGQLARIVERVIARYREPIAEANAENQATVLRLRRQLDQERPGVLGRFSQPIERLRAAFDGMREAIAPHQEAIAEIMATAQRECVEHIDAINDRLDAFYGDAADLQRQIGDELEALLPDPSDVEWMEPNDAYEPEALFDSSRGYLRQIESYKARQGKPTARRQSGGAP